MKRIVSLVAVFTVAATTIFAVVAYAGSSSAKVTTVKVTAKDTFRFTLSKGKHQYKCTVPGHAAAGMKGTFKAT